jgi:hypothetical protein
MTWNVPSEEALKDALLMLTKKDVLTLESLRTAIYYQEEKNHNQVNHIYQVKEINAGQRKGLKENKPAVNGSTGETMDQKVSSDSTSPNQIPTTVLSPSTSHGEERKNIL